MVNTGFRVTSDSANLRRRHVPPFVGTDRCGTVCIQMTTVGQGTRGARK
jgi:hypothetical protein